jgi:trimeric autotransporter adhesin
VELSSSVPGLNPIQTIPISGTGIDALRTSGSAVSTGYLADSDDGTLLSFTAYNSSIDSVNANTLLGRGVATLDANGAFSLQTTYTGVSGNEVRGASSVNNTGWFIGDEGGVYTNNSILPSPPGDFRSMKSFGHTVYVLQAGPTVEPVSTISDPSGGTITPLPGLSAASSTNQDFYLISSGSNGSTFDVLYILSASSATEGTVSKYSLVGGSWTANGTYSTNFGGFGLTAAPTANGSGACLYLTTGTGATADNTVMKLVDTAGYNSPIDIISANSVTLYTAPDGMTLKGIALVPAAASSTPTPTPSP